MAKKTDSKKKKKQKREVRNAMPLKLIPFQAIKQEKDPKSQDKTSEKPKKTKNDN